MLSNGWQHVPSFCETKFPTINFATMKLATTKFAKYEIWQRWYLPRTKLLKTKFATTKLKTIEADGQVDKEKRNPSERRPKVGGQATFRECEFLKRSGERPWKTDGSGTSESYKRSRLKAIGMSSPKSEWNLRRAGKQALKQTSPWSGDGRAQSVPKLKAGGRANSESIRNFDLKSGRLNFKN